MEGYEKAKEKRAIAIGAKNKMSTEDKTKEYYGDKELVECLKEVTAISEPKEIIESILISLGKKCSCHRAYIFEKGDDNRVSNTYEWCAPNIVPQKDLLQNEPMGMFSWWWGIFKTCQPVVIPDIKGIKDRHPQIYAALERQNIVSLAAAPIWNKEELIGFIGVDNPAQEIESIATFLIEIGRFLSAVMEWRNLKDKLRYLNYHDQLTGAYNRRAYNEFLDKFRNNVSVGVVYSDVSGLKKINDMDGHQQGDYWISFWYKMLKEIFVKDKIYRIGGDEFIVICMDITEKDFQAAIKKLHELVSMSEEHLAVGSAWMVEGATNLLELLLKAEKSMYMDKALHYSQIDPVTGKPRDRRRSKGVSFIPQQLDGAGSEELAQFLQNNYFDPIVFFKGLSMSDYYPYIGDLRSNLFYISDEMRDAFGFSSNIVPDLITLWEKRIADPKDVETFRKDMEQIMQGEKDVHDLYYRLKDKNGEDIWAHCHGILKWNEDRTEPLFFSGGVSHYRKNFMVDSITNLPKEYAALQKIRELQAYQGMVTIIGFSLNHFSEINELRGRHAANLFLKKIIKILTQSFDNQLMFCRLDGMRFIAILLPNCADSVSELIRQMKKIINNAYHSNNIMVQTPCSFGMICEKGEENLPQDILVNMVGLLTQAKKTPERDYLIHSQHNIYLQRTKTQMMMRLNRDVLDGFKNFRVVIQPVVSTQDTTVISGEVLLRWRYEGKDVSPTVFIPMLENSRLILKVGQWVLEQAVRTCNRILAYLPDFYLAVNASYYQIIDPGFLPFVEETLKKYNFSGKHLVLEMTETHYDEAPAKVRQFVENCRELGIRVAIDDFGDGYASLAFLIKYPAAVVKLDRSLINEMAASDDNINFIASIVYACHRFGKKVCAEGVETEKEFEILKDSGCDLIQGYYFYKPLELNDFYELLPKKIRWA